MAEVFVKENDSSRSLSDTLYIGSTLIDLTGTTVKAVFSLGSTTVEASASLTGTPTDGKVSCVVPDGVLTVPGRWQHEWEITYGSSKQLTVPTVGYNTVVVNADLN